MNTSVAENASLVPLILVASDRDDLAKKLIEHDEIVPFWNAVSAEGLTTLQNASLTAFISICSVGNIVEKGGLSSGINLTLGPSNCHDQNSRLFR